MTRPDGLAWPWRGARSSLAALAHELGQHDVQVSAVRAYPTVGLLLLPCGIAVWCYARMLSWQNDGQTMTWPAADAYGAARRLAQTVRQGR
ncbi:MAG: hypothetical protein ACRDNF_02335 [Streptosporangiaceae bacterium]